MAEGSGLLPFPSPSTILGDNAPPDLPPEPDLPAAAAAGKHAKKDVNHARRPSNEKKKAAPPRKAPTVEVKDASVVKPKQTKSRNGCRTCKAKRLKCGEEKPSCQNCVKRNLTCGGYLKQFQWREFGQTNVKPTVDRQKQCKLTDNSVPLKADSLRKALTSNSPVRPTSGKASPGSSQTATPSVEVPPALPGVPVLYGPEPKGKTPPANVAHDDGDKTQLQERRARTDSPSHKQDTGPAQDSLHPSPELDQPDPAPPPDSSHPTASDEFATVSFTPLNMFAYRSRSLSPRPARGITPTMTEFLLGDHSVEDAHHQDFVPFSMPEDMQLPMWSTLAENTSFGPGGDFFEEDLEPLRMEQNDDLALSNWPSQWPSCLGTPSRSRSGTPSRHSMPLFHDNPFLYMQPSFHRNSPESLTARFESMTCGILSVMDGPNENPWRSLVWPMAQQSAALFHAILAMTAFHSAHDEPEFRVIGQEHKHLSIQNINEGIRDNSMSDQTAIATALALGFSESWDRLTASGNTHIKGAQALVKRALAQHKMHPLVGIELRRLKFLCNAWVYMDVMARLTSVDSDETTDFDSTYSFAPDAPRMAMGRGGTRGFGIDFGMPVDARLDPLMGCAGTLFPLIGRVANLVKKVCRTDKNAPGVVSQARDLKMMLEDWEPPEEVENPEDPTTGVQNALQTAEAYRWATLLHLHQTVPEVPSMSSAELAQRAMAAVATVPVESRTTIVQIYPLMVAGCEQIEEEDRQWVRERWQAMAERMRIGVLEKCLTVAEEVWRRRDAYEAKPIGQRKLVKTSVLKEARRKSSPRPPRATNAPMAEPGRIGMVFSYVETDSDPIAAQLKDVKGHGPEPARRRRDAEDLVKEDPAYSVRGPLHWVGVMWDWGWEVLLG